VIIINPPFSLPLSSSLVCNGSKCLPSSLPLSSSLVCYVSKCLHFSLPLSSSLVCNGSKCLPFSLPLSSSLVCNGSKLAMRPHLSGTSKPDIGVGITRRPSDDEGGNNTGSDVNSDNTMLLWERFRNLISIKPLHSHMTANSLN
jgi:hypothetical protein